MKKIIVIFALLLMSAGVTAGPRFFIKCYTVPAVLGGEICFKFVDEFIPTVGKKKK